MKDSKITQTTASRPFRPRPLSIEQENAIDLLISGKCDREVGELLAVHRATVQKWRTEHPLFAATLAQRREELFAAHTDRLRAMISQALDNIEEVINSNRHPRWSFELLRAVGLFGYVPAPAEMDPAKRFDALVMHVLAGEKIPGQFDELLVKLGQNPLLRQREGEIRADLMAEYSENNGA